MLNNISWASYAYAIIFILLVYYVVVLTVYYKNDIRKLFHPSTDVNTYSLKDFLPTNQTDQIESPQPVSSTKMSVAELVSILQSLIHNGSSENFHYKEILLSISKQLQNFPEDEVSIIKEKINRFVIAEILHYCSVHLSDEEVSALWMK